MEVIKYNLFAPELGFDTIKNYCVTSYALQMRMDKLHLTYHEDKNNSLAPESYPYLIPEVLR